MSYKDFFHKVCGFEPLPFQERFRESDAEYRVVVVPTGLGKTNTVIADWLDRQNTTRLVYCLPGRALTTQIVEVARQVVKRSGADIKVIELMGGSEQLDLTLDPRHRAILVGTQDILMSRALNRGYARSPFRWPIDFGLLNNDATWVFDEVQLVGDALATSTQLAAFRKGMQTWGQVPCVWMSATFERSWLDTVDFCEEVDVIELNENDRKHEIVSERLIAVKTVEETLACDTPRECAAFVKSEHGKLTLVICNTVARAQEIWDELGKLGLQDTILLHSRFRPCDREEIVEKAIASKSGIIVSTQVIEAGIDMDADLMITDVAPWASLVQRFGRVNRKGKNEGRIYWIRSPQSGKRKAKTDGTEFRPYEASEVHEAIATLETLKSGAPIDLPSKVRQPAPYRFVLRRSDLLDLFDTTPDLTNNHIDVSRFVRSGEETNVYVCWRRWAKNENPPRNGFTQEELCPVPHIPGGTRELKTLIEKQGAWTWNYSTGDWEKVKVNPSRIYAGMRMLLRSEAGGYDTSRGWAPESKEFVKEFVDIAQEPEESLESDLLSEPEGRAQTLAEHTDEVVEELKSIARALKSIEFNGIQPLLERAARYHDWGKAHPVFQQTLHLEALNGVAPNPLLAKQTRKLSRNRHSRKSFRHELASALALLPRRGAFLEAYLGAAHHGKVRVNIRSMPGEVILRDPGARIARGIESGDKLFAADLGGGTNVPETELNLAATELGMVDGLRSWSDCVEDLIDEYGPFRLAYLEMLLRIADETVSRKAAEEK